MFLSRRHTRLGSAALLLLLTAGAAACKDSSGPRDAPAPVLASLSPDTATMGRAGLTFSVTGSGFHETSVVHWDGAPLTTTYVSKTELRAAVPEALLQEGKRVAVTVATPAPGGGSSGAGTFTVRFPTPAITSLSADTFTVGAPGGQVTVIGTGFTRASTVLLNGVAQPTTFQSATQLTVTLAAAALAQPGAAQLTVSNPEPGGGSSAAATINVYSPVPAITLLPSRGATAGGGGFKLTVHGSNFVQGATALWNGAARPATYVSPTRLEVAISAADVASPGSATLAVANPGPGNRSSGPVTITIRAPGSPTVGLRRVPMVSRDLAWDPGTARFYLSGSVSFCGFAGTVAAVDTLSGIHGALTVGAGPNRLARSDDGRYLYVGLDDARAVRRVDLPSFTLGPQWLLDGHVALDLAVAPGQPTTVAVTRISPAGNPMLQGVTVFDAGVPRPATAGRPGGSRIEFLETPSVLYGYDNETAGDGFFTIAVDASGARNADETRGLFSGPFTDIVGAAGRIYGTDGSVVDAERRVRVGTIGSGRAVAADPAAGRAYVLTASGINVYDLNNFQLLGTLAIPSIQLEAPSQTSSVRLVRWGAEGLAFLDLDELIIVRSPLVSGQGGAASAARYARVPAAPRAGCMGGS